MRSKIFLISLIISLPFWWGINVFAGKLENFLFLQEISKNPQILTAQLSSKITEPVRIQNQDNLDIQAKSAISVLITPNGERKILFKKNIQERLPIASLAKLMAADVVLENFDLDQPVKISKEAIAQKEDFGNFKSGEVFTVKDILYSSLIESSNDATYALVEKFGKEGFVALMNLEAKYLGLNNTYFINPTGLDPDNPDELSNYSTAEDLVNLTIHILNKPLIKEIISTPEFNLYLANGKFHHKIITTNKLLEPPSSLNGWKIIGGKTGWEFEAGGCLLLILKDKRTNSYLINVILGADGRFEEMIKLVEGVTKP